MIFSGYYKSTDPFALQAALVFPNYNRSRWVGRYGVPEPRSISLVLSGLLPSLLA